jgi:pimeloyl-ACP methyl ester carboxylesterase
MATKRKGQQWILNTFAGVMGREVLHPGGRGMTEEYGYCHGDMDRVNEKLKSGSMFTKAWATTAQEVETRAEVFEKRGWKPAALDAYLRACLLYGKARYTYFSDDPRKVLFSEKLNECFDKVISYNRTPIERITLDFEGKNIFANLHLNGSKAKSPALVMGPGTDLFKEEWYRIVEQYFLPKGFVALSIDGPGQGESLTRGCKVSWDNYDRAVKTFIDYLIKRPEVDQERIAFFGVSTGSYWGFSAALYDRRIKALATAMGNTGRDWEGEYELAQPNFKKNFMYMAGYEDEEKFDKEIASRMILGDRVKKMTCPSLTIHGEFDELTPLEHVIETYERVAGPKEMWVLEDMFHSMGSLCPYWLNGVGDWLLQMLNGQYEPTMDRRLFWRRSGEIVEGVLKPPWWSAQK